MQIKLFQKTIGKRYEDYLGTMVFCLKVLRDKEQGIRLKPSKIKGLRD